MAETNGSKKTYMLQNTTYYQLRDALRELMLDLPSDVLTPIGIVLVNVHNKSEVTVLLGPGAYDHNELHGLLEGIKSPSIAYIDLPQKHDYESLQAKIDDLRGGGSSDLTETN